MLIHGIKPAVTYRATDGETVHTMTLMFVICSLRFDRFNYSKAEYGEATN
jgi:hypothetical protein